MAFVDKVLICVRCGVEFVFSSGEQQFFADKEFKNDPKHCKQCKAHERNKGYKTRQETRTTCGECGIETTVPFKPTLGKPVLCHLCFKKSRGTADEQRRPFRVK